MEGVRVLETFGSRGGQSRPLTVSSWKERLSSLSDLISSAPNESVKAAKVRMGEGCGSSAREESFPVSSQLAAISLGAPAGQATGVCHRRAGRLSWEQS